MDMNGCAPWRWHGYNKKNSNHFKVIKEFLALPPLRSHKENGSPASLCWHGISTAKSTWTLPTAQLRYPLPSRGWLWN